MKKSLKIVLSMILTAAMLLTVMLPAFASTGKAADNKVRFNFEKVENGPDLLRGAKPAQLAEEALPKGDVRVSIVLDKKSTIDNGYATAGIAANKAAMSYRAQLLAKQNAMADRISKEILGGKKLNVKWNLTLAANIISAVVPSVAIARIAAMDGVKQVFVERQYEPAVVERGASEPNMSTATVMTNAQGVWSNGYTGAGSKIAIIDTGIDTDHKSFNADAFDYAIAQSGQDADLLTAEEVSALYGDLNIARYVDGASAAYVSSKIPFAVNYVDSDLDVTHDNDKQGEHGSHVAGIAAANRFIKEADGTYSNALESVLTQGVAPDAQLLVMKVFGKAGGAYDSDYMIAIEDAIMLGADSVNLSLGSAAAGFVNAGSDVYEEIMESLQGTDTVVSISAGNAGAWADSTQYGLLFGEENNFDTVGSPGSYPNALTVASVDNDGFTGFYINAGGELVFYTENNDYSNAPFTTVAGEQAFVYVDSIGTEEEFAAVADVLKGKIAICNRGSSSFFEKANAAVANGAIAVIIANNQPGTIGLNLTGYNYTAPVVSITQEDGALLKAIATAVKDDEGKTLYYTGSFTVSSDVIVDEPESVDYHTMSSFSSFGVPGDLSLKPEITAPGGNIYSVNGAVPGGQAYENMSGTSMAAPQVAGLAALVAQYIREQGLAEKTGLSVRTLSQSLLMSTAAPMVDGDGYFYPVFQQGAGLADVNAVMNAKSYILMDDMWDYAADGKVKAELGDDPARTGKYDVSFTLNNFTDKDVDYVLEADLFTQYFMYGGMVRDITTDFIYGASTTFTVNGKDLVNLDVPDYDFNKDGLVNAADAVYLLDHLVGKVAEADIDLTNADVDKDGDIDTYDAYLALNEINSVTVNAPANGKVEITAHIDLGPYMPYYYDYNGNYVEGYIYVREVDSDDGAIGVMHTIPVLGYYGGWTESGMTDKLDYVDYLYDDYTLGNSPYSPYYYLSYEQGFMICYAGDSNTYLFGGNPVFPIPIGQEYDEEEDAYYTVYDYDEQYLPERNAINGENGDAIVGAQNTLIRNIAGYRYTVTDEDGNDLMAPVYGDAAYGAYYSASQGQWFSTTHQAAAKFVPSGLQEGDKVTFTVTYAPEYYQKDDGSIDWDALGEGASKSITAVIDNTAPELVDAAVVGYDYETSAWDAIEISAKDNQYIAAIAVFNDEGALLGYSKPDYEASAGEEMTYTLTSEEIKENLELDGQTKLLVAVYDYASNLTTYKMNMDVEDLGNAITVTIDPGYLVLVPGNSARLTAVIEPWGADESVEWESSDPSIATVDANGVVTGVADGECYIAAFSTVDEEAYDYIPVLVKSIDKDLNGVVWDENGEVWVSAFNTAALPAYTPLHEESLKGEYASITYGADGTLYAASFDSEAFVSGLYVMDPETFETVKIGDSEIGYMDLCPAYAIGTGYLYAVYGPYILIVDAASGDYLGAFDMSSYTGGNNLVGIAYEKLFEYQGTYYDFVMFVDEGGTIYDVGIVPTATGFARTAVSSYLNTGYTTDTPYFNSLYFDGESVFWSRFNHEANLVDIIDWDATDSGAVFNLGSFEPGVWPVGGLFELEGAADDGNSISETHATDIVAQAVTEIAPIELKASAAKGTLHSGDVDPIDVTPVLTDEFTQKLELTAADEATNGMITVTYDPAKQTLAGVKSSATHYTYVDDAEAGEITFAYITRTGKDFDKDDVIAELTFTTADTSDGTYTVTTDQINNEHPGTSEDQTVTNEHSYGAPEFTWTKTETGYDVTAAFTCKAHENCSEKNVSVPAAVEKTGETEVSCTQDGTVTYTATVSAFGETYTDTRTDVITPAPGHQLTKTDAVPATCEADGNVEYYTCSSCGKIFAEESAETELTETVVEKLGHNWTETARKDATCTEAGYVDYVCANDATHVKHEDLEALGHAMTFNPATVTCTKDGHIDYYECGNCGKLFADEAGETELTAAEIAKEKLGHAWDAGKIIKEPTCEAGGVMLYTCQNDPRHSKTEFIPAHGHSYGAGLEPSTWTVNGYYYAECVYCGDSFLIAYTDTKLHEAIVDANAWAAENGLDAFISAADTNGKDNTAVIELNVDGIWSDVNIAPDAFDGFMTALGSAITERFGTDDVTINGHAVYADGKLQNTAVKNALFDLGAGFFYKLANLSEDGVFGTYDVTIDGEEIALTVKIAGSDANLTKVKDFASVISEHVSAKVENGNLVIDLIAPEKLVSTIAGMYAGPDTVAEKLKTIQIGAGLKLVAGMEADSVFGSRVSAVNKLCAFLCKLNPLVNKVIGKVTEATVTLADGSNADLLKENSAFTPAGESYTALLNAVIAALDDALLEKTVGDFTETDGVYTLPVNVSVDMSNLGLMAGSTITETVIINLHLFDHCKHAETVEIPAVAATCTETGLTAGSYCRICGETVTAQEEVAALGHDFDDSIEANVSVVDATCTEAGSKTVKCSRCDETQVTEIAAKGHTLVKTDAKAATCTEAGNVEYYTCSVCGKIFADAKGEKELKDVAVPAAGHKLVKTALKPATCTEAGNREYYTCSVCGKIFADAKGVSEIKDTAIPAKGHALEKVEAVAATTEKEGNIAYYRCKDCGKLFADAKGTKELKPADVVIPKIEKQNEKRLGDADLNNKINASDARLALRIAVKLEPYTAKDQQFINADVDENGKVNATDARAILRVAVRLDTPDWASWWLNK